MGYTKRMDPMQLAQMKRTVEWHAEEARHHERDLQTAELALENAKKKVDELRKRAVESKRKLEVYKGDVVRAEAEVRKKIADARH